MSSITVTIAVNGEDVTVGSSEAGALTQGGLYRSATGRVWLYDPQTDADLPWVRVLNKHGQPTGSLIGKRYADTEDDVSFPVTALTEGAEISR
jgi:hypothetical protein